MFRSFVELSVYVLALVALHVVIALTESGAEDCTAIYADHKPKNGLRRGANYTVFCLFDNVSNPCNIEKMAFGLWNNTNLNAKTSRMPDGSGIYVVMTGAEPKHLSSFPFECQYNNHTVDSDKFMIGELLEEVKDFACSYVYYGERDMFCSFTRPEKSYDADPDTIYQLHHKNTSVGCKTNDTDPMVQCILPGASYTRNIRGTLFFRLVMNDSLGVQEREILIDQKEMAIPIKAGIGARVTKHTKDSICLIWENNNIIKEVTWQVNIMEEPHWQLNQDFFWVHRKEHMNTTHLGEAYCLMGLRHPYREYTLNVSRKFENATRWSEPFIYKFTTKPDIPSRPPNLWSGGYQYIDENNRLVVYWQQLEYLERNGPNFINNVTVRRLHDHEEVNNLEIFVEANWATIENLPTGGGKYEIFVHSQNSVGPSNKSSRILIGELEKSAQKRPKLIERNKSKGEISWQAPENAADVSHYMVFWCIENESNHSQCLESTSIAAEKVPKYHTYYVNPNITKDSFKWAVSAIYGEDSGGMVWYTIRGQQTTTSTTLHGIEGVVALLILASLGYLAIRKFRDCSDIGIEFPPGVFSNQDNKDNEQHPMLSIPGRSVQFTDIPLPGSVPPGTPLLGLHLPATPGTPPVGTDTNATPAGLHLTATPDTPPVGTDTMGTTARNFPFEPRPVISSGTDTHGIPSFELPDTPSGYVIPSRPAKLDTFELPLIATPGTHPGSLLDKTIPDIPPPVTSFVTDSLVNRSFALPETPSGYIKPGRSAKPDTLGGYVHVDTVKPGNFSNTLPGIASYGHFSCHALPSRDNSVSCDYVLPGKPRTTPDAPIVPIEGTCDYVAMKVLPLP